MQCPSCRQENLASARFCSGCGSHLEFACPACGHPNSPSSHFCNGCGAKLGGPPSAPVATSRLGAPESYTPRHLAGKILTSKAALEGERKHVTVLFADLKGSMELLADRDPEEARRILDPVLERMMDAVHRYEGTVNQVMGDGIMALFGAPLAHEDHAVRACYAALRMQEAVKRHGKEATGTAGVPVSIRVGLNSGEVVVRSIGNDLHMDYTAVGQTAHLAARMEQAAPPGSILLTADTLRLAEGYVEVTPLGPVPVKGLPEPVEVYELTGAGLTRRRFEVTAVRGLTRFVGREAELAHLGSALKQAGKGHGQVVAVVGEPGVGKSRLFYEFTHSHRADGWRILESGSVSYGKVTPYLPIIDLLRGYFQLEARADQRTVRENITGKLLTLDPMLEPMLPAFLALLDAPVEDPGWQALDPPQRRQRTLDAVKRVLLRESQVQPLSLVFEDLHWIDSETQAVLDSLIESLPTARIVLLVNYRPEYQHGWGSKTYYTQLRIDPLAPASAEELLEALLGVDAGLQPLKRLLIERTEGNPFFLEESVRTLVETHVLAGERGAHRLGTALPSIQVPATVQAVLAARIDRLPAEEKRLLQSAAVIGEEVPFALLQAIADLPEDQLQRGLTHLQAAEFLYEVSFSPELEYTFKHALTHDVAYQSLLQERRKVLHAAIVEAIERLHRDHLAEQVERLAHHATCGEAWDKAVAYWRQAGLRDLSHSSHDEAGGCFEQALAALQRLPASRENVELAIDLRFDMRTAMLPLGHFTKILEHLQEAHRLAEGLDDQRRLGRACAYLTDYFRQVGDHARGLDFGHRGLELAKASGDLALEVATRIYLAHVFYDLGRFRPASELLHRTVESVRAVSEHERFGLPYIVSVHSRTWLALCLAELGQFPEALELANQAMRIAAASEHPSSLTSAHVAVGRVHLRRGDMASTLPILERGLDLSRRWNIRLLFPFLAEALGLAYVYSGRVDDGLPLLREAQAVHSAMRGGAGQAIRLVSLSQGHLAAGEMDEADRLAVAALEMARRYDEMGNAAYALFQRGEVARGRAPQDPERAMTHYREALTIADELEMRPLAARCRLGLGIARRQRADVAAALDLLTSLAMPLWREQAERALAELL